MEPTERIVLVVRVFGDTRHRTGVQELVQQRPDPADEHRCVRVDDPCRAVGPEEAGVIVGCSPHRRCIAAAQGAPQLSLEFESSPVDR